MGEEKRAAGNGTDARPAWERDDTLSKQPRIRRGSEIPRVVLREMERAAKYPHQFRLGDRGDELVARYRRSRWESVFEYEGVVQMRKTFCWIYRDRKRVGALKFQEIKVNIETTDQDFFDAMDAESSAAGELAGTLCVEWQDVIFEVMGYGPVLEFQTAWMSPAYAQGSRWASFATHLIARLYPEHSILVMKAFPLEYEGRCPVGSPAHAGLRLRQRAMVRHYQRLLGVRPFDGPPGAEGWMWRPNNTLADVITEPRYRSELDW